MSPDHHAVIAEIDAANGGDVRRTVVDGTSRPTEVVYAQRMSDALARLYPDASRQLRIAAHAQHICRWQIPRANYPLGRAGYHDWRTACRLHHIALVTPILRRHGYGEAQIAQVARIIGKQDLKRDSESQALENVAGVVFVQYYLGDFVAAHADYTSDKFIDIVRKTWRKMDAVGHAALVALPLPPDLKRVLDAAAK